MPRHGSACLARLASDNLPQRQLTGLEIILASEMLKTVVVAGIGFAVLATKHNFVLKAAIGDTPTLFFATAGRSTPCPNHLAGYVEMPVKIADADRAGHVFRVNKSPVGA